MKYIERLAQLLIFLPTIFCFSYLLRPILMAIVIPGGLILLALIGGTEIRTEMINMIKEQLWFIPTNFRNRVS